MGRQRGQRGHEGDVKLRDAPRSPSRARKGVRSTAGEAFVPYDPQGLGQPESEWACVEVALSYLRKMVEGWR